MNTLKPNTHDYLLVPANVQAFLVGGEDKTDVYDLAKVPRNQQENKNWYRDTEFKFSFQNKLDSLAKGLHLHWALPSALMHSTYAEEEESKQACIPNRWLVLRMWHAADDSRIQSKGWVIESDYVSRDNAFGGTPFPFMSTDATELRFVGRTFPLQGWKETHPDYRFEFTSAAWGDLIFSAYYPACKGVLGFHDNLQGVNKGDSLSYLIIGWYSEPTRDPLYSVDRPKSKQADKELLESLGWSCQLQDGTALPQGTLCHGSVVDISWQGAKHMYSATASDTQYNTAIGSNEAEAIAALLNPGQEQLQQVLCAFQHGQAMQVSDEYQLSDLLERHGFGAIPGGKRWTLESHSQPANPQSSQMPVSEKVQSLLNKLNQAQQAFDRQSRKIDSLQSQFFACWLAWANKQKGVRSKRPQPDVMDEAKNELHTARNKLAENERQVQGFKRSLIETLVLEKSTMQLQPSTMPPFLHPKDPFVVIQGEDLVGVDRVQAQDNLVGNKSLRCRLVTDPVTGLSQSGLIQKTWMATACFDLEESFYKMDIPAREIISRLAHETLLFDPNCVGLIDTKGDKILDTELFKQLQLSLEQKKQSAKNTLSWNGKAPHPLSVTRWGKYNPWLPVSLLWQARWLPSYPNKEPVMALDGWELDAQPLAGGIVPSASSKQPTGDYVIFEGSTILSTISTMQLAANIKAFYGDKQTRLRSIRQTHLLGQSLGGLNDLLLRQALGLCLPPVNPDTKELDSVIWEAIGQEPQPTIQLDSSGSGFLPVRAGSLKLENLYLVDSFGQVKRIIDSGSSATEQSAAFAAATLPSSPEDYHASFSPCLVQPARLNFDWQPIGAETTSPVCGWIVANYLEKSFAVFSANGEPLGSLESVLPALGERTIDSSVTFKWQPVPGSTLQPEGIDNPQLKRLVELVTEFSADEGQAFLQLVDLVLRKTASRDPAEDPNMAILLGRPLALVQASLELEIEGLAAGYWNTEGEWSFDTKGFEKLRVPVSLGDMKMPSDGLVGYLPENENCLITCAGAKQTLESERIIYEQSLTLACADDHPNSVTLLMDASARVHTTTGILPRHHIELSSELVHQANLIEEVYVSVAPLLGERTDDDMMQPTMPKPSDAFGQWSWGTRPALSWQEIKPSDDQARFASNLALSEGWLRLQLQRNQRNTLPDNNE